MSEANSTGKGTGRASLEAGGSSSVMDTVRMRSYLFRVVPGMTADKRATDLELAEIFEIAVAPKNPSGLIGEPYSLLVAMIAIHTSHGTPVEDQLDHQTQVGGRGG